MMNELHFSNSDNMRGWNWDGKTASYVAQLHDGKTYLFIRPFDGKDFKPVTTQIKMSDADKIRGWSWDGKTASYFGVDMVNDDPVTTLYVRPFDGKDFKAVEFQQKMSSKSKFLSWSWNGQEATYVGTQADGHTYLFVRAFDGKKLSESYHQELISPDLNLRGLSRATQQDKVSYAAFADGKTSLFPEAQRPADNGAFFQAFWWGYHFVFTRDIMEKLDKEISKSEGVRQVIEGVIAGTAAATSPAGWLVGVVIGMIEAQWWVMKKIDQGKGVYLSSIYLNPYYLIPTPITE